MALMADFIAAASTTGGAGRRSMAATRPASAANTSAWTPELAPQGSSGARSGAQNGDRATPATIRISKTENQSAAGLHALRGCALSAAGGSGGTGSAGRSVRSAGRSSLCPSDIVLAFLFSLAGARRGGDRVLRAAPIDWAAGQFAGRTTAVRRAPRRRQR